MAISRFNYTGLKKINRSDVHIVLSAPQGESVGFEAELSLSNYNFPPESLVFVEAYRQTAWMRFCFGTVSANVRPVDTKLSEFDSADDIQFRVRVTAAGEQTGKMLGEADRIRPAGEIDDNDERSPLLRVRAAELGDEIYKVEMAPTPVLLINCSTGDWRAIAASPIFQAVAAPAIFRSILIHFLIIEDAYDAEDVESPHIRWLQFAHSLPGVAEYNPDTADPISWIDDAVAAFARQKKVLSSFMGYWRGGH